MTAEPMANDGAQRRAPSLRPIAILLAVVFSVLASAAVILYVRAAVTHIEGELPLRVMQEKRAMERVARHFFEYLAANEAAVSNPGAIQVDALRERIGELDDDLRELREHHSFDTLIGASALHAALDPVVEDLRRWIYEGFGGLPADSPLVLGLAAGRARDALPEVYNKTAEADRIAYEILQRQAGELGQLRQLLVLVIIVFAALAAGLVGLAIWQHRAAQGREAAEAEQQRLQARLREALESTLEGFAFFDVNERLVTCNTRYREYFLRDIRDVIVPRVRFAEIAEGSARQSVVAAAGADPAGWVRERIERFRKASGPFAQQFGDGRWVMINERRTADGGTVAVYSDITELKQREIELLHAKEGAEAANLAKSAFLANVSHELRTPLTSILGFTRIIQRRLEEIILPRVDCGEARTARAIRQVRDNLSIMLIESQRLTTLINTVLDLEKIEAGEMVWTIEPLDIAETIAQAAAATDALYRQKDLAFSCDIAPGLPPALGDRDRVLQVIINLISNAVKFTDTGRVTCRAALADGDCIRVEVVDTGSGIAPEDQAAVFEKFRQVGDTLTDKPAGTGLGLPICKEIVEHLGGRIGVDSAPGRGSTFHFTLPVAPTGSAAGAIVGA